MPQFDCDIEQYLTKDIDELRRILVSIRDSSLSLGANDANMVSASWRWARKEYVPNTTGNRQSVRWYLVNAHRISRIRQNSN